MRASIVLAFLTAIIFSQTSNQAYAAAYLWTGQADIAGDINDPTFISFGLVVTNPGSYPFSCSVCSDTESHNVGSYDSGSHLLATGTGATSFSFSSVNDPEASGPPFSPLILFQSGQMQITDAFRYIRPISGDPGFSHHTGISSGAQYFFEILLPDGLSVAGEEPIAPAVPESSTWTMMLCGLSGLYLIGRRYSPIQVAKHRWCHQNPS